MDNEEYIISSLEDIISKHTSSPSMVYEEIKKFVSQYDSAELKKLLGYDYPFGELKLAQLVIDVVDGKQVSASAITSLDFSEVDEELKIKPEDAKSVLAKILTDNEKFYEPMNCPLTEEHFRALLVEPLFVSDWEQNQHEMVKDYDYPDLTVDADNITNTGTMDALCSPVTVSLLEKCKLQTEEPIIEESPLCKAANAASLYFPTFDEYVEQVRGVTLTPEVMKELTDSANTIIHSDIHVASLPRKEDFSIFGKIKSMKGLQYVLSLLNKRGPTTSSSKEFSVEEGVSALAKLASTVDEKDIGKLHRDNEIPTGDTAQKRGGSSAPRSQGGGTR